jgi:hypothetical protein
MPKNISTDSIYIIKKPKTFMEKLKEVFTSTDEEVVGFKPLFPL